MDSVCSIQHTIPFLCLRVYLVIYGFKSHDASGLKSLGSQDGPKIEIFLPQPSTYSDFRCATPGFTILLTRTFDTVTSHCV